MADASSCEEPMRLQPGNLKPGGFPEIDELWEALRLGEGPGEVAVGDLVVLGERAVLQVTSLGERGAGVSSWGRGGRIRVLAGGEVFGEAAVRWLRPSRDLAVVVLAGGRSTRFGGDKRLAPAGDGRTLLEAAVDVARQTVDEVLLSVGAHEAALRVEGAVTVPDEEPDAGPLGGLAASLAACRAPTVVAFAVDQPGVTADLLRVLAARSRGPGLFLRRGAELHPLPCCLDREALLPAVRSALVAGRRALHRVFESAGVQTLDVDSLADLGAPDRLLVNVNTPEDCPGAGPAS